MELPEGLVVLGDAACCFNPVFGQGMTVAVLGAELLAESLAARGVGSDASSPSSRREALMGLSRVRPSPMPPCRRLIVVWRKPTVTALHAELKAGLLAGLSRRRKSCLWGVLASVLVWVGGGRSICF